MSVEAISWALAQPLRQSTAKFVLVVLANCAHGDTMTAFPSIAYLVDATSQDRKTVCANLRRLIELGLITDTGERRGTTKQIIVYQLNRSKNGTVEQTQKRNSTETGTVPKTDANSTVFPCKESRFSAKQSQKRNTEPLEPSRNRKSNQKDTREPVALPDWLPQETWDAWCRHRKSLKGKFTPEAERYSLRTLTKLRDEGNDPRAVIEKAIENSWRGLFPLRQDQAPKNGKPPIAQQFAQKTYLGTPDDELPNFLR